MRTEYWNGGNIQAAIESLMMARSLCEAMQKELHGGAIIHPRDYIGGSDSEDYAADVAEWRGMLDRIRELEQHFEQRAMQLDALRSNERQRLAMATMVESYNGLNARGHRAEVKP